MAVFESTIKVDSEGKWFIEIKDVNLDRVEKAFSMEEYEKKIEELASEYGGYVDEVKWSADSEVSPQVLNEIRVYMKEYQEKLGLELK